MDVTDEIRCSAVALGEALRQTRVVQEYLEAKAHMLADPQAVELELSLDARLAALNARQEAGELPNPDEMDAYFALRSRAWAHPLITKVNATLGLLKPVFVDVADDISAELSVDYAQLATPK